MKLEIINNSNTLHQFNKASFVTLAPSIEPHEKHKFNYRKKVLIKGLILDLKLGYYEFEKNKI